MERERDVEESGNMWKMMREGGIKRDSGHENHLDYGISEGSEFFLRAQYSLLCFSCVRWSNFIPVLSSSAVRGC